MNDDRLKFYVDGSSRGNPGQGGFGICRLDNLEKICYTYNRQYENVTNNQMELEAIIYVMKNFGDSNPIVYSDSSYAINSLTNWGFTWRDNNWIKPSNKKPPENLNLIKEYFELYDSGKRIELIKVNGHTGLIGNEIADKLAKGIYKE